MVCVRLHWQIHEYSMFEKIHAYDIELVYVDVYIVNINKDVNPVNC
jgi:hypothetical protein